MGIGQKAASLVAWNQVVLKIQQAARFVNTQFFFAPGYDANRMAPVPLQALI
jgi:hypothetical protein